MSADNIKSFEEMIITSVQSNFDPSIIPKYKIGVFNKVNADDAVTGPSCFSYVVNSINGTNYIGNKINITENTIAILFAFNVSIDENFSNFFNTLDTTKVFSLKLINKDHSLFNLKDNFTIWINEVLKINTIFKRDSCIISGYANSFKVDKETNQGAGIITSSQIGLKLS